jgi:hypothetical protein
MYAEIEDWMLLNDSGIPIRMAPKTEEEIQEEREDQAQRVKRLRKECDQTRRDQVELVVRQVCTPLYPKFAAANAAHKHHIKKLARQRSLSELERQRTRDIAATAGSGRRYGLGQRYLADAMLAAARNPRPAQQPRTKQEDPRCCPIPMRR